MGLKFFLWGSKRILVLAPTGLTLDSSLERNELAWKPFVSRESEVRQTANWCPKYFNGTKARDLLISGINVFQGATW